MKLAFPVWVVLAGALLAPVPAAAQAAAHPRAASSAPTAWQVSAVPSSVQEPATLDGVSAASASSAWAVGAQAETGWQQGTPLLLKWNGKAWSTVALSGITGPGNLTSVSAASATDAWAVGQDKSGAVALHWNGTKWSPVTLPGSSTATVYGVAVAPGGTAWLVGSVQSAGGTSTILVENWNGKAWHVVKTGLGAGYLQSVQVSASGDVWVGGATSIDNVSSAKGVVASEQDGTWKRLPTPGITHITSMLAVSATDVWAVGDKYDLTNGAVGPELGHWNGTKWAQQVVAAVSVGEDLSISPDSAGQPQWVGVSEGLIGLKTTLYAYYNGTAWSNLPGATPTPTSPGADTVTAHIPGTGATWGVGGLIASTIGNLEPGDAVIEYNP
jgi:hypothetical protein